MRAKRIPVRKSFASKISPLKYKFAFGIIISVLLVSATLPALAFASPEPEYAEYAIIVVIDGCTPLYLETFDTPNIDALMEDGLYFPNAWVGDVAASTIVSHAVIHTGSFPKRSGIIEYAWRDSTTLEVADYSALVYGGLVKGIMENEALPSISDWVKKQYTGAKTAGGSTKPHVGVTFEPDMDIIFYETKSKIDNLDYVVPGYKVPEYLESEPRILWADRKTLDDKWVVDVAIEILQQDEPRFMLLNLPLVDTKGHIYGGENALEEMESWVKNADTQVGRLVSELKALGIYEETLLVVCADHGMMPGYWVYTVEDIWRPIRDAGIRVAGHHEAPYDYSKVSISGLSMSMIWLENTLQAKAAAEALGAAKLERVKAIYYKIEDPVVGYRFMPLVGPDPIYDDLAQTAAAFSGPDVLAFFDEYTIFYDTNVSYLMEKAQHGGAQWRVQNVPLILSGPGVPEGVKYHTAAFAGPKLVDIAPTVLYLMNIAGEGGVVGEYGMDGRVLMEELYAAKVMAGEIPAGPAGPAGEAGPPGEPAPTDVVWGTLVVAIIAICIAAYAVVRKR